MSNEQTISAFPEKTILATTMETFFLPKSEDEGVKMPLVTAKGAPTEHWLIIRGRWSDAYLKMQDKIANINASEQLLSDALKTSRMDLQRMSRIPLIAGWSFPQECNDAAVSDFLKKAPHIAQQIEVFAWNNANFFDK